MSVLRLSPDLTIVPSMVQSVEVSPRLRMIQMGTYGPADEPEGYAVAVTYLMADKPHYVASFDLGPDWVVEAEGPPREVRWLEYHERSPSREECEARATRAVFLSERRAMREMHRRNGLA